MSNLVPSFRYPVHIPHGSADPTVIDAIGYHDDAITDLQQAIPELKSQIEAVKAGTTTSTSTTPNVSTSSETVVTAANVIGLVNSQTGLTSYTTQQSDYGAEIQLNDSSAIAVSLAVYPVISLPWFTSINNLGTGTATLTPQSGTINGSSSLSIPGGSFATVYFDGTNFTAEIPASSGSGVTQIIAGTNVTISPVGGTGAVTVNATGGGSGPLRGSILFTGISATGYYTHSTTITGASMGAAVAWSPVPGTSSFYPDSTSISAWVSAADTVTVGLYWTNPGGSVIVPEFDLAVFN
jgi:hypothetical protein